MLVQFSISNIFSFKEKATFSLLTAPIKEKDLNLNENKFSINKCELLKTSAVYGANSSGKSNLFRALKFFVEFITIRSNIINENDNTGILPFLLSTTTSNLPSEFEITLYENNIFYTYFFSLTNSEVISESLSVRKERENPIFSRNKMEFDIPKKYEKMNELYKRKMIPKNSLLISKAAVFNEKIAIDFINALNSIKILSGIDDSLYRNYSMELLKDDFKKKQIIELMKFADDSIEDLITIPIEADSISFQLKSGKQELLPEKKIVYDVQVRKSVFDSNKNIVDRINLNFNFFESDGTKKFFHISGPLLDCLSNGYTLFVDELDTKLHPLLVKKILEMFYSPKMNPKNAQLVFNVHNTSLLNLKTFRRDQIWLTEKSEYGETELFSLVDFKKENKKIRNDESIERNYLIGKYGAIPFFEQIELN